MEIIAGATWGRACHAPVRATAGQFSEPARPRQPSNFGREKYRRFGGKCLTPKNETPTHPQNQRGRGSVTLYGALSAKTNQMTWFYGDTKDSTGMIDLVEILFNQYHDKSRIYITWDAASWHGSDKLVEWVNDFNTWNQAKSYGPIIEFVPLTSSAQFLNVIEA